MGVVVGSCVKKNTLLSVTKIIVRQIKFFLKKTRYKFDKRYRVIKKSGLFNEEYYRAENLDLPLNFLDPIIHYLEYGHVEGRNPNFLFDTSWYWSRYPLIAKKKINPLYHYLTAGWKEGKNPNGMFETAYYLNENPGVVGAKINPLTHFINDGVKQRCNPNPLFDTKYYIEQNKEVSLLGHNPLVHYMQYGVWEGRLPAKPEGILDKSLKISILVPVYNVPEKYLRACIDSVINQVYPTWELCLVDDASSEEHIGSILKEYELKDSRIKAKLLNTNAGIAGATNAAFEMATGEYVAFLDNDDELTRNALYEVVRTIHSKQPDMIYSDECIVNKEGTFQEAHFKPDFSPDLLFCHNYITHFVTIRKSLFDHVGGLSSSCDGAQDYDLLLKVCEQTDEIVHIPKVLYRWRTIETSTSGNPAAKSYAVDAGKTALENSLKRREIKAKVFNANLPFYYRVKRKLLGSPLVSILIPFRDQPEYLEKCVTSILERTGYQNFEIICVSNNSEKEETFSLIDQLSARDDRIRFIEYNQAFNYSAINNFGVGHCKGEHIVLMNNDIEIITEDWLEVMLEHSQRREIGAVGAKLYYPDDTIQHAGVIVGISGFAGHGHRFFDRKSPGYFNRLQCIQNVSAVTAALLMVKKDYYLQVAGLDEEHLGVALNDVDFCLKLMDKGYSNIFTPYAEAYHYESISRGYEDTPEKKARFKKEIFWFKKKWQNFLAIGDPYFNRNLELGENYQRQRYLKWYESEAHREGVLQGDMKTDQP